MSLGLGLGIDKSGKSAWLPSDESTLEAWYKNGTGITVDVGVQRWVDSSKNSYTMEQSTDTKQPAYSAGTLTFDPDASQSLVSSTAIGGVRGLEEEFIIGFKIDPEEHNTIVLGHTSTQSEMIKLLNASTIRVKPSTSNVDFTMESGHDVKDASSWIIVRKSNDEVTVYKDVGGDNLVQQDDAKACAGDFILDSIGRRAGETPNYFDGTMKEIVIFKDVEDADSDDLRDNLYARLKSL